MDLRKQIKILKVEKETTYKIISKESGVPYSKLLNYIEGKTQKLSEENEQLMNSYLIGGC